LNKFKEQGPTNPVSISVTPKEESEYGESEPNETPILTPESDSNSGQSNSFDVDVEYEDTDDKLTHLHSFA